MVKKAWDLSNQKIEKIEINNIAMEGEDCFSQILVNLGERNGEIKYLQSISQKYLKHTNQKVLLILQRG